MKEYDDVQDMIENGGHVKFFEKILVDLAEDEGMPPDMVENLRNRFDLHEEIRVKQNDN